MSNKELGRAYLKVNSVYAGTFAYNKTIYNIIIKSPINIFNYFQEHKKLDDLKVKGLGKRAKKTKSILELIIINGEAVAYEIISKEREKIPSLITFDFCGSSRHFSKAETSDSDSFFDTYKRICDG